jgi:pilus assembly protein TadC
MRSVFAITMLLPLLAVFAVPAPIAVISTGIVAAISPALILAAAAAFLGPLITFIVTARRFSGKIETTEAHDLWEESSRLRGDLLRRIDILNGVVARLEKRNEDLESRILALENENIGLHRELDAVQSEG